jgi:hypothetical protein
MAVTRMSGGVGLMTGQIDHCCASLMIWRGGQCDGQHRTVQAHKAEHDGKNRSPQASTETGCSHSAHISGAQVGRYPAGRIFPTAGFRSQVRAAERERQRIAL